MKAFMALALASMITSTVFAAEITAQEARQELVGLVPASTKGLIAFEGISFNGVLKRGEYRSALTISLESPIYEVNQGHVFSRGVQVAVEFELDDASYMIDRSIERSQGLVTTKIKLRNRRSREGYRDYVSKEEVRITRTARGALVRVSLSYQDKEKSVSGTLEPKDWQDPTRI